MSEALMSIRIEFERAVKEESGHMVYIIEIMSNRT